MLTVTQAQELILREVSAFASAAVPLDAALGRFLAEDIVCRLDSPPFDKSLMDGYAVHSSDITHEGVELLILEEVTAGRTPSQPVGPGQATRIMTGAPIPDGADAVVPVEQTEALPGERVRILRPSIPPEANLIRQGTNRRVGERVLPAGRRLRAQELGALAELGHARVSVRRPAQVAVLATGDELVSIAEIPGPGQIRNSNETMLCAQILEAGAEPRPLGVARDNRDDLRKHIDEGLQADILLLTGGVSAGVLDLVPSELERAGVRQVFHKVNVKPGKPVWFGVLPRAERPCYVFGLPGNPVSTMVCFELFARTALRKLHGDPSPVPRRQTARLAHAHHHRDDRETWFPAVLEWRDADVMVRLMNWHGSSDLLATCDADCLVVFPAEPRSCQAGELVEILRW